MTIFGGNVTNTRVYFLVCMILSVISNKGYISNKFGVFPYWLESIHTEVFLLYNDELHDAF